MPPDVIILSPLFLIKQSLLFINKGTSHPKEIYSDLLDICVIYLYDDFILPEALVKFGEDQVARELEQASSEKEIPKEEKEKRREEGIKNTKMDLRMKIILDSIGDFEELQFDNNEVAREFVQLAQITGQSPDELIKSPFGHEMYERISVRKKSDATLDRVVARVFGDPIEKHSSKNLEHVHNEDCEHDHS